MPSVLRVELLLLSLLSSAGRFRTEPVESTVTVTSFVIVTTPATTTTAAAAAAAAAEGAEESETNGDIVSNESLSFFKMESGVVDLTVDTSLCEAAAEAGVEGEEKSDPKTEKVSAICLSISTPLQNINNFF